MNIKYFLENFSFNGLKTIVELKKIKGKNIRYFINEYWTSKQRQSNSIHEISYRACFKAELPNFFIKLLSKEGDIIYDPFSGRGTTLIEAALLNRNIIMNDINPLSKILIEPRLNPPKLKEIEDRLEKIKLKKFQNNNNEDLSMFFHNETFKEILILKEYLKSKDKILKEDYIDKWIRMVATNRLTGHSKGFFSVYTLPPNQAVSKERQIKINQKLNQKPEYRNIKEIIIKKSKSLLKDIGKDELYNLNKIGKNAKYQNNNSYETMNIEDNSVNLIITSPPFLDVINYLQDNWLRCWFNDINIQNIKTTELKKIEEWCDFMIKNFKEFFRIVKNKGYIAFEVGEVKGGKINLDEYVINIGLNCGFKCIGVLINKQNFSKTSNIWGIKNNNKGTNTNRIIIFQK